MRKIEQLGRIEYIMFAPSARLPKKSGGMTGTIQVVYRCQTRGIKTPHVFQLLTSLIGSRRNWRDMVADDEEENRPRNDSAE